MSSGIGTPSVLVPTPHALSLDGALPLLLTEILGDHVCTPITPWDNPLVDKNGDSTSCTPLLNTPKNGQELLAKELPSSSQAPPSTLPAWHSICHPQGAYFSKPRHRHQLPNSVSWTNTHSKLSWLYREIPPQKWTPSPPQLFDRSSSSTTISSTNSWLDNWDHRSKPGVMLQATEPWDD